MHLTNANFKIVVVNHYLDILFNKIKIAKIFNCSRQNLINRVRQFRKTGSLLGGKNKPASYKITKKYIFFIKKFLQTNKTITIKLLHSELSNNFIGFRTILI